MTKLHPPDSVRIYPDSDVGSDRLLHGTPDRDFQRLLYNLLAFSFHLNNCRRHLAKKFGLGGPPYSILMAVARFEEEGGVCPGALAKILHVSPAFITIEVRNLVTKGLLERRRHAGDAREIRLKTTERARQLINQYAELLRDLNQDTYGELTSDEFQGLMKTVEKLVSGARKSVETAK
jgi:DNA-binding MarR family transcriptional regulator